MTKLRPCPFCGGTPEIEDVGAINVACRCGAVLFGRVGHGMETLAKWNTRVGDLREIAGRDGRLVRVEEGRALLDLGNGVECWCPIDELEDVG